MLISSKLRIYGMLGSTQGVLFNGDRITWVFSSVQIAEDDENPELGL